MFRASLRPSSGGQTACSLPWLESSNLLHIVHTACQPTLQHHNSHNRTENDRQWNAVWPRDDGRKDARNMLRNYWLPIKSLIVASSWSHLYLLVIVSSARFNTKIPAFFIHWMYVFRIILRVINYYFPITFTKWPMQWKLTFVCKVWN